AADRRGQDRHPRGIHDRGHHRLRLSLGAPRRTARRCRFRSRRLNVLPPRIGRPYASPVTSAKTWFQASRPMSFTAAIVPALVGSLLAADETFSWWKALLAIAGSVFFLAGTN